MRIGVLGLNHKLATLNLREKMAKICSRRFGETNSIHSRLSYVLLSTCNRTEIYFHSPDLPETHIYLLNVLRSGMEEAFEHRMYSYFGVDCFDHLACVTAGFDSAVLGETEIQGQVKQAYESAMNYRKLPHELHFLFQKSLKIGKEVRSQYPFGRKRPTLEETIYQAGQQFLGELHRKRILFVGLSKINHRIFSHFHHKHLPHLTFCNRTESKLLDLHAKSLPWEHIDEWKNYDLVILGTKCPHFVIDRAPLQLEKQILLIDLSVPRNVDPKVGRHPQIKLHNIDQIARLIRHKEEFETEAISAAAHRQVAIFNLKELQRLNAFSRVS